MLNYNDADEQKEFGGLIPVGTCASVKMMIKPGGYGDEGLLKQSKSSDNVYLECEFTVFNGPFARRKIWQNLMISGPTLSDESIAITNSFLRGVLESSRGIEAGDTGELACKARSVKGYDDFNKLDEFAVKIGIDKAAPNSGWDDKNKILNVITPGKAHYVEAMSGKAKTPTDSSPSGTAAPWKADAAAAAASVDPEPDAPKPDWAK